MTFKPALWYPIANALVVLNLLGAGFAIAQTEPLHAATHGALALAFALWARHLRQGPAPSAPDERLETLEADVGRLRQELNEMQERLDFTERVLAQGAEARRVGPQRPGP